MSRRRKYCSCQPWYDFIGVPQRLRREYDEEILKKKKGSGNEFDWAIEALEAEKIKIKNSTSDVYITYRTGYKIKSKKEIIAELESAIQKLEGRDERENYSWKLGVCRSERWCNLDSCNHGKFKYYLK